MFSPNLSLSRTVRTKMPSAALFTSHRKKLSALLGERSITIVQPNDMQVTNADAFHAFKQNNDLFYLTGVAQEETVLILFPDAREPEDREILFLRESNEHIAIWEGAKLTKEQARERTGIARIEWTTEFNGIFSRLMQQADSVFLSINEHPRGDLTYGTKSLRFARECQELFPLHNYRRLAPLIYGLRSIKSEEEIEFTQSACDITEAGFRRVLGFVEPGVGEWEVEAEFVHEFVKHGSRGFAYGPIIAGGRNACILHYIPNDQPLKDGELLLLDVAAEYGGWNADMTRTIPVSGKFTPRQKEVYNAVLRMVRYADSILRPGVFIADYHKMVVAQMDKELIGLGLYTAEEAAAAPKDKPLVKKYYMHGTSHHLGLDVHDVSPANQPVAPGMIFTIEPGIYIPEEGMGIRLENDYLIGENGNIDLMANIPIEAEEIEALMAR
jgi:Xaa-Pro aminopeptidase